KPTEAQVIVECFAEGALAADREQTHQQTRLQQPFRRDRCSTRASGGVQFIKLRRELGQGRVGQLLDRSQGMIRWDTTLWINERQHAGLGVCPSAHASTLYPNYLLPEGPVAFFNDLLGPLLIYSVPRLPKFGSPTNCRER